MSRLAFVAALFSACGARSVRVGGFDAGPCEEDPTAEGCPCIPATETCNALDDDCDGEIDEGVLNACGACGDGCDCWGPDPGCADWGDDVVAAARTEAGGLEIERPSGADVLWATHFREGKVFRIDTRTLEIQAAFWSSPNRYVEEGGGDRCDDMAIDAEGDAYVTNETYRSTPTYGSITKVAAADCPDRDADGEIQTSHAADELLAFDSEASWADDCIRWHTVLGAAPNVDPATVAVQLRSGLDGELETVVWVGMDDDVERVDGSRFWPIVQLDGETGEPTGVEIQSDVPVRESAIDRQGYLWTTAGGDDLTVFDTRLPERSGDTVPVAAGAMIYHLTHGADGTVWTSGGGVYRRRPGDEEWQRAEVDPPFGLTGVLALDGLGSAWVGADNFLYRIDDDDDMDVDEHDPPRHDPSPKGLAFDFEGRLWVVHGAATIIDTRTYEQTYLFGGDPELITRAGAELTNFASWLVRHDTTAWSSHSAGCADGATDWKRLRIEADLPEGASLAVFARAAGDPNEWFPLGTIPPDVDLDLEAAGLSGIGAIELRIALLSPVPRNGPTLRRVDLEWSCSPSP